ncbi:MAG: anaerobic sulfatase maturase [Steroidobacteraceae bacterium]
MSPMSGVHVLAKPTGAICNLDCKYCFFLSKEMLYPGDRFRMSNELLETYIRQLLGLQPLGDVNVAWQGGEPTLMGIDFFRRAMACVERHRKAGQNILHTIQTNGTLLDDEWCEFFKQHNVLVGLSVDGPQPMHDAYRVNKRGAGSFADVMQGYEALRRHEVDVNILCTIHAANADFPLEVYRFFRDELHAAYMQFIPIVERTTEALIPLANLGWGKRPGGDRPLYTQHGAQVTDRSVGAEQFGRFLVAIFDEWVRRDVGKVFVQTFDVALGSWLGQHNLCIFSPTCGNAVALEHNGDLYSCDHYVEPAYRLGNIRETGIDALVSSPKQRAFGQHKLDSLPKYCRECSVLFACYGECPRNRFISAPDGEPGLNYLCAGYKLFFNHINPAMNTMAGLLRQNRFADEIMQLSNP